jgi:YidC/Oxa1 family membrane protein insertase
MTFTPTPFDPHGTSPKGGDVRNIILFALLVLGMSYAFNHFVVEPRNQAAKIYQDHVVTKHTQAVEEGTITPVPQTRDDVVAGADRVDLGNARVRATLSSIRPRLDDVALIEYTTTLESTDPVRVLMPAGTDHPSYTETGWLAADAAIKTPGADAQWAVVQDGTNGAKTFIWENGQGVVFTRTFVVDDQYMFTVTDQVQNLGTTAITLYPYARLVQHGIPDGHQTGIVHEGAIGYAGDDYMSVSYNGFEDLANAPKQTTVTGGWIGITSRYFFAGLIPDQADQTVFRAAYRGVDNPADVYARPRYQVDTQGSARIVDAGKAVTVVHHIFVGPKVLRLLETYEDELSLKHFDLVVDFGWFYFLTKPFYYALVYLFDWVGNFGVAILLLTLALRLAVFPLANTSFKSFAKMKQVAPQIQELQKTYIHDKRKMQEELVKLYTKEKVNPMSGCLPILAQIPIFFAMYKVISVAIEMRHAPFFGWIQDLTAPDPTSILNLFGALPFDVHEFFHFGVWPCVLFVMIMIQVRLSPPPPDKMMKIFFSYYYPVVVCFIMAKFAAGLVIYWTFSAFLSIAQQMFIMHRMGVPIHLFERFKQEKQNI